METMLSPRQFFRVTVALLASSSVVSAGTIIDDDFDDGTVTGWESIGNSLAATHDFTESGSELTSVVVGTGANLNTNRGIISTAAFDPAADPGGFSMTFEVVSQGDTAPGANGLFLGATSSNTTFFRLDGVPNFGLVFFGHATRTLSNGGVSIVTNDIGNGGSAAQGLILDANPTSIELASLQDGFTATLGADPTGWSFSVAGINDLGGTPTTFEKTGTWAAAGMDFASVFGSTTEWYVLASNQGEPSDNTHTVVYDRITLSTGAPDADKFRIISITPDLIGDDPSVTLAWNSIPNTAYAIDFSTDLSEGTWAEITDSEPATGELTEYLHKLLPGYSELVGAERIYYRIRIP